MFLETLWSLVKVDKEVRYRLDLVRIVVLDR